MSRDRVTAMLRGFLEQSFYNLAVGEDDNAIGLDKMAAKIHENYQLRTGRGTVTNRTELAPITELKRDILFEMLTPTTNVNPEFQAVLRTKLRLPADFALPSTNAPAGDAAK